MAAPRPYTDSVLSHLSGDCSMKRKEQGKASLVEFLSSIKFSRKPNRVADDIEMGRFAAFKQQVCPSSLSTREDRFLVRSAN